MQEVKKFVSNATYIFLDYAVMAIFSLFYWIIAGKILSPVEYGVAATAVNFVVLLSNFSGFGMSFAVWKLIPEYLGKKQIGKIGSLVKFSLKFVVLTVAIIGALLLLFSSVVTSNLKFSFDVLLVVIVSLLVLSLSNLLGYVLLGLQNPKRLFISDAVGSIFKLLVSSVLIILGFSYFGPLLGLLSCFLVVTILRLPSAFLKSGTNIDKKAVVFGYAIPALISTVAWSIFVNGQYVILTTIKSPEVTGFFAVAMILTSQIFILPNTITQALFSITSGLSVSSNKRKKQNYMINLVFRYVLFITLPIVMFMILFSKPIVLLFSSQQYLPATELFPILAIGSLVYACGNVFLTSLYASGKPQVNRNIHLISVLTFLLLSIPLTYLFSSFGLAVAYTSAIFVLSLLSYIFIRKHLHIILPKKTILKLVIAIALSFGFFYTATLFTTGFIWGLIWAGLSMAIYILTLLILGFYIKDDINIIKMFVDGIPVFKKQINMILDFISEYAQNTIS